MIHTFKTKCDITIKGFYEGSTLSYPDIYLPKGMRCIPSGVQGKFFLDQLPKEIFPSGSCLRHDAEHYGIFIEAENVEDVTIPPVGIPSTKEVSVAALTRGMTSARKETVTPYASKRQGFFWVFLNMRMDGTYIVAVRHEEAMNATVVYEGQSASDAIAAWTAPR